MSELEGLGGSPRGRKSSFAMISKLFGSKSSESSDEECFDEQVERMIKENGRGIVSFSVYCVKTDTSKQLHIVLYNGKIYQYDHRNRRKVMSCNDVQNIIICPDHNVIIEVRRPRDVNVREKRYIFRTDQSALLYKKYVEHLKEYGNLIKRTFNLFDRKGDGVLTAISLDFALRCYDISTSAEDIRNMLKLSDANFFDFDSYFHLMWDTPITSPRECLLVWLKKSETFRKAQISIEDSGVLEEIEIPTYFETLPGEFVVKKLESCHWSVMADAKAGTCTFTSPGTVHITIYRITVTSTRSRSYTGDDYHSSYEYIPFFNALSVPLCSIYKIYLSQPQCCINIVTKDFRHMRIILSKDEQSKAEGLVQLIELMIYNRNYIEYENPYGHLFAFRFHCLFKNDGWKYSDVRTEYARQGLDDEAKWQIIDNSQYELVDTYPEYLVLPAAMTSLEIVAAINYRSKGRLPVVTYRHKQSGAVMTRSAQPLVGLTAKKCPADEKLLDLYRLRGISSDPRELDMPSKFYILDARRKIAATLNKAAGKGTEDISTYYNTDLIFCDIDNIHVMRTSVLSLAELLSQSSAEVGMTLDADEMITSGNQISSSELGGVGGGFYQKLEDSGWMKHLQLIIKASLLGAEKLHLEGASVLVHCSDGWDRTAQLCSVIQILLDPFFRTIEGFAYLIEKEWCAFGYKFQDRCGHGEDPTYFPDERSPIFLQFLDVLHQVMLQFPTAFEFNDLFVVFVADHMHSGLFGNFLGNYSQHRMKFLNVTETAHSIWSYVMDNKPRFLNARFRPYSRPIWPSYGMSKLQIWSRYFCRWDPKAHPNRLSGEEWLDDWGKAFETKPSQGDTKSSYRFTGSVRYDSRVLSWGLDASHRDQIEEKEAEAEAERESIDTDALKNDLAGANNHLSAGSDHRIPREASDESVENEYDATLSHVEAELSAGHMNNDGITASDPLGPDRLPSQSQAPSDVAEGGDSRQGSVRLSNNADPELDIEFTDEVPLDLTAATISAPLNAHAEALPTTTEPIAVEEFESKEPEAVYDVRSPVFDDDAWGSPAAADDQFGSDSVSEQQQQPNQNYSGDMQEPAPSNESEHSQPGDIAADIAAAGDILPPSLVEEENSTTLELVEAGPLTTITESEEVKETDTDGAAVAPEQVSPENPNDHEVIETPDASPSATIGKKAQQNKKSGGNKKKGKK